MEYKIVITQGFESDLDNALEYITHKLFNPVSAARLLESVEEKISVICENPLIYPIYHDESIAEKGYHYVVISNYLLFYTVDEPAKTVFILRFLYGGQNILNII